MARDHWWGSLSEEEKERINESRKIAIACLCSPNPLDSPADQLRQKRGRSPSITSPKTRQPPSERSSTSPPSPP
jgi:hypothetical protein